MRLRSVGMAIFIFVCCAPFAQAEEFFCEVLAVEGTATLTRASEAPKAIQDGDLLQVDDAIEVGADAYVDIAYDKDWSNVTRVEENSKIVIRSVQPTTIDLAKGGVYAKLKALPKDSTFEVKTPTAIASVRGTEYRTVVAGGETEIYNLSDSDVYVYSMDEAGSRQDTPVVLANSQKTQVVQRGRPPVAPRPMEQRDFQPAERMRQGMDQKIQENIARGRVGKIHDVKAIERFHEQRRGEGKIGGHNVFSDKDVERRSAGELRSDEAGKTSSGDKREPMRPISGEDARNRVHEMTGSSHDNAAKNGEGFDRGRSVFAGDKAGDGGFEGRGLGQPYFPSDEHTRSGGPEPAGFPSDRWKSGYEKDRKAQGQGQNFERNREHSSMGQHHREGPDGQGPNSRPGNQKGGGQSRGGGKPAPRR